ncbi:hypothetical protein GGR53DRAFT_89490 [Hypoxylon sp. FL1150]|nr:hypothetical protein GGR53DRAFT_89490 [Hypoxylon sp. FL1150]
MRTDTVLGASAYSSEPLMHQAMWLVSLYAAYGIDLIVLSFETTPMGRCGRGLDYERSVTQCVYTSNLPCRPMRHRFFRRQQGTRMGRRSYFRRQNVTLGIRLGSIDSGSPRLRSTQLGDKGWMAVYVPDSCSTMFLKTTRDGRENPSDQRLDLFLVLLSIARERICSTWNRSV